MGKRSLADAPKDRLFKLAEEENIRGKMVNTRLPPDLIKRMKHVCVDNDITMQQFMTAAVEDKLKEFGG